VAQLPRILIIPAERACLNLFFILNHIRLLATPSYQAPPIESMAAQYRDIKVLIHIVPLLLAHPFRWLHIGRRVLLAIFTKNVLQAYRAILLIHMVLKQTFLISIIFVFLLFLVLRVDVSILKCRELANFRLYKIVLLVVVVAHELLGWLQRIHLYHNDIRILIWPF